MNELDPLEEADNGYKEFRGRCKELSEAAVAADPILDSCARTLLLSYLEFRSGSLVDHARRWNYLRSNSLPISFQRSWNLHTFRWSFLL